MPRFSRLAIGSVKQRIRFNILSTSLPFVLGKIFFDYFTQALDVTFILTPHSLYPS